MDDLADLLRAVAEEHHAAFAATDGVDPEWAEWYAHRLVPRLSRASVPGTVDPAVLAWLTVEQMVEADKLAIDDFGISLLQMMEHAGSALADMVRLLAPVGRITVLAGAGNNGGGGLCAARHLANRGRDVEIVLASDTPGDSVRHHLRTLSAMGIEPSPRTHWPSRCGRTRGLRLGRSTARASGRTSRLVIRAYRDLVGFPLRARVLRRRDTERNPDARVAEGCASRRPTLVPGGPRPAGSAVAANGREELPSVHLWTHRAGRTVSSVDDAKRATAHAAVDFVRSGSGLGVGSGSTVERFIDALGESTTRPAFVVPTSDRSESLLRGIGLSVVELGGSTRPIEIYVDGADEIDRHGRAIKGGGGAHTREKLVAAASETWVCIVDESKVVSRLGRAAVPLEVEDAALRDVQATLLGWGVSSRVRGQWNANPGHVLLDLTGLDLADPSNTESRLESLPGVVACGIFAHRTADIILVGHPDGRVDTLRPEK